MTVIPGTLAEADTGLKPRDSANHTGTPTNVRPCGLSTPASGGGRSADRARRANTTGEIIGGADASHLNSANEFCAPVAVS
ncbi:hypothetical protein [Virgisporangium aliadipatigenens]|nr:hypothetical protein [Virgisporangium aliadipatigenens]